MVDFARLEEKRTLILKHLTSALSLVQDCPIEELNDTLDYVQSDLDKIGEIITAVHMDSED